MIVRDCWALVTIQAGQGLPSRQITIYGFSSLESFKLYVTCREQLAKTVDVMSGYAKGKPYDDAQESHGGFK